MKFCPKCGKQLQDGEVCSCQSGQPQGNEQGQFGGQPQDNMQGQFGGQPQGNVQGQFGGQPQGNVQGQFGGQPQGNMQGQFGGQPQGNVQGQFGGQPQGSMQGQFGGQPQGNMQGQFGGQPNGQYNPQVAYVKPTSDPMIKDLADLLKGLVKKPADAIASYVQKTSVGAPLILLAIYAVINAAVSVIQKIAVNIKYSENFYYTGKPYYPFGKIAMGAFQEILQVGVSAVLLAGLLLLLLNLFEKDKHVTFVQTLAVASLGSLIFAPLFCIGSIVELIPLKFFTYLSSWIQTFGLAAGNIFTFFGIRAIEKDDNNMPLIYGLAALSVAILQTILQLLFR